MSLRAKSFQGILLCSVFTSCANVRPITTTKTKPNATPSQAINNFKSETDRLQLTQAITQEKISDKNENFLAPHAGAKKQMWIKYFTTKGKERLQRFINYGERYRPVVESTFEKYGLPKDLYYVGIIESGYQNRATSHAGAVGPWQFVKATARRYGLKVNRSIDERRNIYKSTEAAALYFQDLYNIFGSWELALAAYNAGEYGIIRRIRGANTREYYELSQRKIIPRETRNYVPKVLAVMDIFKNAHKYGLRIPSGESKFYTQTKSIKIQQGVHIATLAKSLKVPTQALLNLNQDIKARYIPRPGKNGFELIIPSNAKQTKQFLAYLAKNKSEKNVRRALASRKTQRRRSATHYEYHQVRKNESLHSISKRYNVKLSSLKAANRLRRDTIYIGQKIKIPTSSKHTKILSSYTVKRGDYLIKIAQKFKTNTQRLKKLNRLHRNSVYAGQKIKLPPRKITHYTVKRGDILANIAQAHNKSIRELRLYNNVGNIIYPGQKLIIDVQKI